MSRMSLTRRGFLGLTAGIGLAGCARGAGGQVGNFDHVDISTPSRYRNRPHQIVLWSTWSGVNGLALDGLLERFNQSQDQIYAQAQFQGSYAVSAPKLVAAMQARKVPDIMVLADTYWGRFLLSDTLEPLNPYFGSDFRQEDFVDELIGEGVTGGKLYWVSFARSTPLFYYNRDLFAKAGLPDRGPHTWTELREWGREITKIKVNGAPTSSADVSRRA
jgi:sn-glycerol 3-phosphate transport system substrate-binding protein